MSKIQLSDATLDAIAGGQLTFGGEAVNHTKVSKGGLTFTTASGKEHTLPWSDDIQKKIQKDKLYTFDLTNEFFKKGLEGTVYKLEDYLKTD